MLKVLSLFDGISCGQLALNRVNIEYEYYASEIDKYAIQVTQHHYPNTIQLGDATKVKNIDADLLMAGSPCQGFSFAGKQLNFEDPRSKLFFEYVRLKNAICPKYWLLENVCMKKEYENRISDLLGAEPVLINSSLISAQNRKRLYWSNLKIVPPQDKGITWGDIREHGVQDFYYKSGGLEWIRRHSERTGKKLAIWPNSGKCQMIEASHYKKYSSQRFFGIEDVHGLRYITPKECERAQTIPDDYTSMLSNTQRYKCIGNAWTVDVISHILSGI